MAGISGQMPVLQYENIAVEDHSLVIQCKLAIYGEEGVVQTSNETM